MARPRKYVIKLTENEYKKLKSIIRKKATSKTIRCRCQIILALAAEHGHRHIGGWNVNIRIHDVVEALGELFARLDEIVRGAVLQQLFDLGSFCKCTVLDIVTFRYFLDMRFQEVGKIGSDLHALVGENRDSHRRIEDVYDGCL